MSIPIISRCELTAGYLLLGEGWSLSLCACVCIYIYINSLGFQSVRARVLCACVLRGNRGKYKENIKQGIREEENRRKSFSFRPNAYVHIRTHARRRYTRRKALKTIKSGDNLSARRRNFH